MVKCTFVVTLNGTMCSIQPGFTTSVKLGLPINHIYVIDYPTTIKKEQRERESVYVSGWARETKLKLNVVTLFNVILCYSIESCGSAVKCMKL